MKLINVKEMAVLMKVSEETVRRKIRSGKLSATRKGKAYYFRKPTNFTDAPSPVVLKINDSYAISGTYTNATYDNTSQQLLVTCGAESFVLDERLVPDLVSVLLSMNDIKDGGSFGDD